MYLPHATAFNLFAHLVHQREWSTKTFGPMDGSAGAREHLKLELEEVAEDPCAEEWADVVILALDGAMRDGIEPDELIYAIQKKQAKNEKRVWPDWRDAEPGKPIQHVKGIHD